MPRNLLCEIEILKNFWIKALVFVTLFYNILN